MNQKKWPSDYPTDVEVPPNDAVEVDDILFRFVKNEVPNEMDFVPSYKDPRQRHLARNPAVRKKPSFYGTSFFGTAEGIEEVASRSPEKFANDYIASGPVKPDDGKGEYSARTDHVSIWFYEGVYPKEFKTK